MPTRRPRSTYRLQIRESFDLDAAADVVDYLRDLGADWVYLSPLLTATAGSDHGYDVVDATTVDPARGGAAGLARLAAAARAAGLGILIDVVPNHMGVAEPPQNAWWWDVLMHGRDAAHAGFFDIDWEYGEGRVRLPILGAEIGDVLAAGELEVQHPPVPGVDAPHGAIRYYDHVLPLAPGSLDAIAGAADRNVADVLRRQHWEPVFWRREEETLNYRRFFTITTLAGLRIEVPEVFDAAHAEILRWMREGLADGLRVDHPDGLVDPGAYFDRLAAATGDAYVLVEKILEHGEELPAWWATSGTTGYDALAEIDRVLIDPRGEAPLDALDASLRADTGLPPAASWADLIHATKRRIVDEAQTAELRRVVRALPEPVSDADEALAELLAWFPVYRSYLPAGRENLDAAATVVRARRPELSAALESLVPVLADPSQETSRRFQQTTGPVMAKGVEDTAFYRTTRLGTLTEVGADPSQFALPVGGFHEAAMRRQSAWPDAMTARTTHDTKRGEDVRARLAVLSEIPERWTSVLGELRAVASTGHGPFDSLLWQAVVGAWPASPERLRAYAEKAAREAAEKTTYQDPDEAFEERVRGVVDAAFGAARGIVEAFVAEIEPFGWSNSLSGKLLQIAGPGVPDVYQGSELWELSLVDPDNRRAVDFTDRRRMLAGIDEPGAALPGVDATGAAKLLVTSRALRLRRDRPELFDRYRPMTVVGPASDHAVAFDRGGVVAVATRLPVGLAARGWGDTSLLRQPRPAIDVLTGRRIDGGEVRLAELLSRYPVALLAPLEPADGRKESR